MNFGQVIILITVVSMNTACISVTLWIYYLIRQRVIDAIDQQDVRSQVHQEEVRQLLQLTKNWVYSAKDADQRAASALQQVVKESAQVVKEAATPPSRADLAEKIEEIPRRIAEKLGSR